jgi:transcriptional regulator with XRE-family HTH domain
MERYPTKLWQRRRQLGLSQQELANLVHCDRSMISHLEHRRRGTSPRLGRKIGSAVGLPVWELSFPAYEVMPEEAATP